ncbi:hypothetical protein AD006_30505 (plasmid) [Pseudonocardia sp. EC080610-09]|uniref:Lsr2 dimerization domain-containing protein n=1 Tax=unclassified Pseudonocardia TaxID=2619320 RepID=UPI0007069C11|nr:MULTISPECIES: histone-like nucleoid-structuring protein Lsr2 [unclassified Pseudonocardia]ALL79544.1 hypothetical protein AD006_30505 [Pseudonocardia sp. EC080610-09]ALL85503.1 hypothetical protein AD017_30745 [Pseudonocardia sp. EC080619-01]
MGVRQIRFCDLTGVEDDVESHELHIDQMRIEIDLAGEEYRKLLAALRPYLDAGRVEASAPEEVRSPARRTGSEPVRKRRRPTRSGLSAKERDQVRQWAEAKGMDVPQNNRFKRSLIEQWRQETERGEQVQVAG